MCWSTYLGKDGIARAAVWAEDRLHLVPGPVALLDLLGDDGTRLREAADRALREPGVDPTTIRLAPPVPRPPSIRDFMAFEEHVVTASAARFNATGSRGPDWRGSGTRASNPPRRHARIQRSSVSRETRTRRPAGSVCSAAAASC